MPEQTPAPVPGPWFLREHMGTIIRHKHPRPENARRNGLTLGSYHATWQEAHKALVQRQERAVANAEAVLRRERAFLKRYAKMQPPTK